MALQINVLHSVIFFIGADIFLRLIQLMQDNSPERLKHVYVINGKYNLKIDRNFVKLLWNYDKKNFKLTII